jgi:hypothetical protein
MTDLTYLLEAEGVPLIRENGASAPGGVPMAPPAPIGGVGLSKRRYSPRAARTYYEMRDAEDAEYRADEIEDETEDSEDELLQLFEAAATSLQAVITAMRARRAVTATD